MKLFHSRLAMACMFFFILARCGHSAHPDSAPMQGGTNIKATIGNFIYSLQPGSPALVESSVRFFPLSDPSKSQTLVLASYTTAEIMLLPGTQYRFEIDWGSGSIGKTIQVSQDSILMIIGGMNSFPDIQILPDQPGIEMINLSAFRPSLSNRNLYLCTRPGASSLNLPYGAVHIVTTPDARTQDVWLYAGRYLSDKQDCQTYLLTIKALKLPKIDKSNKGQIYIVGAASLNLPMKVVLNHDIYDADTVFLPFVTK